MISSGFEAIKTPRPPHHCPLVGRHSNEPSNLFDATIVTHGPRGNNASEAIHLFLSHQRWTPLQNWTTLISQQQQQQQGHALRSRDPHGTPRFVPNVSGS